jgi:dTMP kinase
MNVDGGRRRGFFLTLEGPEGSGKSTQARRLADRLTALGFDCLVTREPGGTALGEAVRQILLHSPELTPVPAADALLFNAARAQLAAEVIEPALARGDVVICDRFGDSTLAYQGYGAGQPLETLRSLQEFAAGGLRPDMTVLIDLPPEVGLARKQADEVTRFEERADLDFHRRVRDGFLALAAAEPERFAIVDGRLTADAIEESIFDTLRKRLVPVGGSGQLSGRTIAAASGNSSAHSSEPEPGPLRMER